MKKITVLLCDDHSVVRKGLRFLLEAADDIEVVAEAENGHAAVEEANKCQPDVVLMDIVMGLLNGLEATRRILQQIPTAKVLILSCYSDDQRMQQAVEAGAAGYLMKETSSEHLLRAIREVRGGNAFFSPPIAARLLRQWRNRRLQSDSLGSAPLTNRQTELVQLIAEGYSSKQIADLLSLHVKTVGKHRQTLMEKLNLRGIAEVTRYAVSSGLVDLNRISDWQVKPAGGTEEKTVGL